MKRRLEDFSATESATTLLGRWATRAGFALLLATTACATAPLLAQRDLKNVPDPDPEIERKSFIVADGFEVNLYASDPRIAKPIQMNFDERGRLWIATSEVYPHIKPGQKADDKVLMIEDRNGDGRADATTVFADGLLIPTGIAPGDDGVYVANSTELVHFRDTDGDGRADMRRVVLSGFGTEDTHHLLHTLRWGHDGMLYFNQSIYIHSHIETPHGVRRLDAGGIWHFRPETMELDVFMRGLVNGWGHHFDRWGQSFATDGAGGEGINYTFPGALHVTASGARRVIHGLNPGSPKHCGLEILSGRHLPESWRGSMVTNDFRAHRVCRFVVTESASGYTSRQQPEVLKTTHGAFRPVDVKMGPDGAIYVADWYNPIIQHGEVDFRDPRRDHTHGRIWRITAKGRPLVKPPKLADASVGELLDALRAPEEWTRLHAKLMLRRRGAKEVVPELAQWVRRLDSKGSAHGSTGGTDRNAPAPVPADVPGDDVEHHRLEALWAYQTLGICEPKLLAACLASKDHRVRAAATRVMYHEHRRLPRAMTWLAAAVRDEHPRVRLEAVRALSRLQTVRAADLALEALDYPLDPLLDFALWQTLRDLKSLWLPEVLAGRSDFGGNARRRTYALQAADSPQVAGPLMQLLAAGKLPPEREEGVLLLVASLGGPDELAKILDLVFDPKSPAARRAVLAGAVVDASIRRRIRPSGDLARMLTLLEPSGELRVRVAAAHAAGAWNVAGAEETLARLAADSDAPAALREATMQGLASLRTPSALKTLTGFTGVKHPAPVRSTAIAALAAADMPAAAESGASYLATLGPGNDPSNVIAAMIGRKDGAARLTAALQGKTLNADVAKLAVRAARRSAQPQPQLVEMLRKAGRLTETAHWSVAQRQNLLDDVLRRGNAARGESVFRRAEQSCLKCHAVAGAGGKVGPDLVSIGASAQIDYLLESLLEPSKKIKENYHSLVIENDDGQVITGVKIRDAGDAVILRDVQDREISVLKSAIVEQQDGGSLMPAGLVDSLTRDELVDLVRFLSELGKVGPYAASSEPVVRTWRVAAPSAEDATRFLRTGPQGPAPGNTASMEPAYSTVGGTLPLDSVPTRAVADRGTFGIARFEVDVTGSGTFGLDFVDATGCLVWIDGKPVPAAPKLQVASGGGRHEVTIVVDTSKRKTGLRATVFDVDGSSAQAQVIGGK